MDDAVPVPRQPAAPPQPQDRDGWVSDPALESLDDAALLEWENRGIPSLTRASDALEARADERQDIASSLSFPFHVSSANLAWNYLFDVAVVGDLLSPRSDDLVLDIAAGTCWVTELLNRLGVRTVSIDISHEMMRRGRWRLAHDGRLVFRHEAQFVAARAQTLPFADDTFDGVICLNALHHVPSYREALSEIFRVLRPGGRAVFSEPGTAHADAPLSTFRMHEEQVIEKPVSLPHIYRLARDVGFTGMSVVPLRSPSTYLVDYRADAHVTQDIEHTWRDTLRHAPREHARFALQKGEARDADSTLHARALTGHVGATLHVLETPERVQAGHAFTTRLRLVNSGMLRWKAVGRRFGGQVTCGMRLFDADGRFLRDDLGRTPLPHDVAPGESVEITMTVTEAPPPGRYTLRYDMVVEGIGWFEIYGTVPVVRSLISVP